MAIYASNEKARFDYEILETLEAGMVLTGQEVKSVKRGSASIKGAYVKILGGEGWLLGATIPPYQAGNVPPDFDSRKNRKLLLKKSEIKHLIGKTQQKGLTLIPLRVYAKNGKIKLEFGLARGKKMADKRELIRKREIEREIERELKSRG